MILWLIDPLEKLNLTKDSTFFLAHLAQTLGQTNLFTHDIILKDSKLFCQATSIDIQVDVEAFPGNTVKPKADMKEYALQDFDLVMQRLEPPLDERYLQQTKLLTLHKRVLNSPSALLSYSEKLLPLFLGNGIPTSLGIKIAPEDGVVKPMNLFGGTGVEKVLRGAPIKENNFYQPFRSAIKEGEKRYFVMGSEVFGEVLKIPAPQEFRSNSMHGAKIEYRAPNPTLIEKTRALVPQLNQLGIHLAAVDYIADEIIEINFTCPSLWNFWYKHVGKEERERMLGALKSTLLNYSS